MTREDIKAMLPVLQAFAEGKEIESRVNDKWYRVLEICNETNPQDYRIKPESTYRPFKDAEECWQEMLKHEPFGWLNDKKDRSHSLITYIETNEEGVFINGIGNYSFNEIMEKFTFADGTPFGILEDE